MVRPSCTTQSKSRGTKDSAKADTSEPSRYVTTAASYSAYDGDTQDFLEAQEAHDALGLGTGAGVALLSEADEYTKKL